MAFEFDPFPQPESREPGAFSAAWKPVQLELARRVRIEPLADAPPRFVAGADCAFSRDKRSIHAVALVWDRQTHRIVDMTSETRPLHIPYISGYLSFREGPAIAAAVTKLVHPFGVICFDGQGIAHPRRCGLASHMGVALDVPSIGVGKSKLLGTFADPPASAGSTSPLMHRDEQIGVVLRTREGVKPLFVSVGHRLDLTTTLETLMACVTRYRVPEPTRLADVEVAKVKALAEARVQGPAEPRVR